MCQLTSLMVLCILLSIPGIKSEPEKDLDVDILNSQTTDEKVIISNSQDEVSLAYDKMCKNYWKSFEESNGQYIESIETACLLANIKPHNHDDIISKKKNLADRMAHKRVEMAARNTEL